MALSDDLQSQVKEIFSAVLKKREGQKVPETEDITLGTEAVTLNATVLYADLAASTSLVDNYKDYFAAEIYKAYLHCASKIIRSEGGVITAFDGDRVMGVYIGESKNTSAVSCALKINHAVTHIINPAIKNQYQNSPNSVNATYSISHSVGIDTSNLFVARTGIRGYNDLVWVGRAANYAAKLCSLRESYYASFITEEVYRSMNTSAKYSNGQHMWEKNYWSEKGIYIYRSSWWRKP
ncbi:MAG: adenylate/guanylate cyclase domain-containing protein [Abitibacteriaceae bacterium]|nr:adenylate/guanylate cyclase domain-containing protein [Abditibacteriaceae bacterium]